MGCGASAAHEERRLQDVLAEAREIIRASAATPDGGSAKRITDEDRELIREIATAARVKQYAVDSSSSGPAHSTADQWHSLCDAYGVDGLGDRIIRRLFEIEPHARVIFYGLPIDRHAVAIVRMMDTVVKVDQQAAVVVPSLMALGARHRLYGMDIDHLPSMATACIETVDALTDGGLSAEEREEWERVFGIVTSLMVNGMLSAEGLSNLRKYEERAARIVQNAWREVRLVQAEGPEEKRLFTRCMYLRIIEQRPDFKRFSNLTDFRTAGRVMQMLTELVDGNADGRDSSATLRESGVRHRQYGVSVDDLRAFEPPFLETCEDYLGAAYKPPVAYHLSRFWRFVVDGMAVGLDGTDESGDNAHAPREPPFAILFTDVEKSTKLWEKNPPAMGKAIEAHNAAIRTLIHEYGGYEVKTIGDSFMVAVSNMTDAVLLACGIQTELLARGAPAEGFKMVTPTQGSGPSDVWNDQTLRVRVGIAWCTEVSASFDALHRRYDYYGPSVNLAARVEGCAGGGQVLMTGEALAALKAEPRFESALAPPEFVKGATTADTLQRSVAVTPFIMDAELKGISRSVDLYTVAPTRLAARQFDAAARRKQLRESGSAPSSTLLKATNSARGFGGRRGSATSTH